MPRYRLHRIKETQRENFRWSPHTGGLAVIKPKDYEPGDELESASPYSLWKELRNEKSKEITAPLVPGDVLEAISDNQPASLWIAKYIGFEPAVWFVPEPKTPEVVPSPIPSPQ